MTPRGVLYTGSVLGGAILGSLVWVVIFLTVSWVACAYEWPVAPCWACKGNGTRPGSSKRRSGPCRKCRGTRQRQVIGSRTVHRVVRSLVAYKKKEK